MANRVFATARKFFGWLVERDVILASPCVGVRMPTAELSQAITLKVVVAPVAEVQGN